MAAYSPGRNESNFQQSPSFKNLTAVKDGIGGPSKAICVVPFAASHRTSRHSSNNLFFSSLWALSTCKSSLMLVRPEAVHRFGKASSSPDCRASKILFQQASAEFAGVLFRGELAFAVSAVALFWGELGAMAEAFPPAEPFGGTAVCPQPTRTAKMGDAATSQDRLPFIALLLYAQHCSAAQSPVSLEVAVLACLATRGSARKSLHTAAASSTVPCDSATSVG